MCTNNKIHIKNFVYWREIQSDMDKIGRINVSILCMLSNIYILYMCKSEIIRNRLIGYLVFKSVIGNLETTDRLTGYSVKVHSTSTM